MNVRRPAYPPVLQRLGSLTVQRFMQAYWQRRPLLIRSALPGWKAEVDRSRLFELASDSTAESRVVARRGNRWHVQHGPFDNLESRTRRSPWTLLVQGVDLLDERAHALLSRFRFVPDARLDDLMASYATDSGGVGPHVDSYDVFLLQASGCRRWQISRQSDLRLVPDAPLRLLANFKPTAEWLLQPGDLLYLPPGIAHNGVAVGECITYSIGFRAPSYQELLDPWVADWAADVSLRGRYADRGQRATAHPAALPSAMTDAVHRQLSRRQPGRGDTERFLLKYLTEPKANVVFARPRALSAAAFGQRALRHGVRPARATRMLYAARTFAINGECFCPSSGHPELRRFANQRELAPDRLAAVSAELLTLLHDWYGAGWIELSGKR